MDIHYLLLSQSSVVRALNKVWINEKVQKGFHTRVKTMEFNHLQSTHIEKLFTSIIPSKTAE